LALLAMSMSPADAKATGAEKQPVVQEWDANGEAVDGPSVGFTNLVRKPTGISGTTHVSSLKTGGVYTFWIVAIDPAFFPDEDDLTQIFVARGNSAIVGRNGRATVHWSAAAGQSSIDTSGVSGPTFDDALADIDERIVRIEIAYHGQSDAASYDPSWQEDFWSGDTSVCADPPFGPANNLPPGTQGMMQPHCPVNYASTHAP